MLIGNIRSSFDTIVTCPWFNSSDSLHVRSAGPRALASLATAAETLLGVLLVIGWKTRITALLSGILLVLFALTMAKGLGVQAPLISRFLRLQVERCC
jgi:uncharacterized membrane protein YphA (DoxX/SURF4 family)